MTFTVPSLEDHLQAIKTALDQHGAGEATAHLMHAPRGDARPPWWVIYPRPGGGFDGSLADPDCDLTLAFQITCVAFDPAEAAHLRDLASRALQQHTLTIPGRSVMRIRPDGGPVGDAQRDDTEQPPLFYVTPLFVLTTTPA